MSKNLALFTVVLAAGLLGGACSGDDGKDGATGATGDRGDDGKDGAVGADGSQGEAGPAGVDGAMGSQGEPGADGMVPTGTIGTSCLSPCHGFTGIVEQWKTSRHFATYISNLGGEEVETWTGQTTCGNCHAIDGIEQRLDENVIFAGTTGPVNLAHGQISYKNSSTSAISESAYAGHANVAVVHCSTCHDTAAGNDPHLTGEDYVAGSFPLRVPSGADDEALLERSSAAGVSDGTPAGEYGKGNACVWCHKSRKDVTNYILAADNNNVSSMHWGPHEGPHSDVFTGKGGYEYSGKTYSNGSHQNLANGCVNCHMPGVSTNQDIGDHSFYAQQSACTKCHATAKNFDVLGGQSKTKTGLQRLRVALNDAGLLSRDGLAPLSDAVLADSSFALDKALPKKPVSTALAGALYNYFILARGSALGVHNPSYTGQLIYDSVQAIGGDLTGLTRP
jgi:Collagen triple helix repeat (20 copies)/Cytochrome c552